MSQFEVSSPLLHERDVRWGDNLLRIRLHRWADYSAKLLIRVRAAVFCASKVVVVTALGEGQVMNHVMPGGRVERGETWQEALQREVGEECGWTIGTPRPIALLHFHYRSPKTKDHLYAYPDFREPIFVAEAVKYDRRLLKRAGEVETGSRLMPVRRTLALIGLEQQILL